MGPSPWLRTFGWNFLKHYWALQPGQWWQWQSREERDKWMIAGDISSWAEGGASMCHTVTPPAQTTISSGQDFITIYQKIQSLFSFFFSFFPTRRRRQWTIPAWSWWCCMTRVFLGYQKTIIKLIFLLALGPLPYFADFLMSHSECWTMGGGEKASVLVSTLHHPPAGAMCWVDTALRDQPAPTLSWTGGAGRG